MSSFEEKVNFFVSHGYNAEKAIDKILEKEAQERNLELEKVKLEQMRESKINTGESRDSVCVNCEVLIPP